MKKHIKLLISRHKLSRSLFAVYFSCAAFLFIFSLYALFNKVMIQYESFGQTPTTITVNPAVTYQTMTGWEATNYSGQDQTNFNQFKDQLFDKAVNEYGMNRVRLEIRSGVENSVDYWTLYQNGQIPYTYDATNPNLCPPDASTIYWRLIRYATENDNTIVDINNSSHLEPDPQAPSVNWRFKGFQFAELDNNIDNIILPIRQKMNANGENLHINMNYVAFTGQLCPIYGSDPNSITDSYHHASKADAFSFNEYAEFVEATFLHMYRKYGFVPDTYEIILEPDNVTTFWNGRGIARAVLAIQTRLASIRNPPGGFHPKFVLPSVTDMSNAPGWIDDFTIEIQAVKGISAGNAFITNNVAEFSYHTYRGTATDPLRQEVADRAKNNGIYNGINYSGVNINTSMLEWWDNGNDYRRLLKEIKIGMNSAWQEAVICGLFNCSSGTIQIINKAKLTRQYVKKIRLGAQRISATTPGCPDDQVCVTGTDPVAFKNADGLNPNSYTVVIAESNASGRTYSISGLPGGSYGGFYTTQSNCIQGTSVAAYDVQIPNQPISLAQGQNLSVSIPACGVLTIYTVTLGPTPTSGPSPTPTSTPIPNPGSLNLSSSSISASENAGSVSLNVQRAGGSSGIVSVNYAISNGSAIAGSDYTQTQGTVTFTNGDTAPKSITVPIINDTLAEQSETFSVTLSAPTGGALLGTPATAIVTIQDDDSPPTQVFPIGYYAFDEGAGSIAGDSTGSGNNGTIYNGVTPGAIWVDGKFGKAIQFDGVNDYVNLGNNFNFALDQPFSISLWVNPVSGTTTVSRMLIDKRDGSATGTGYQLRYTTTKGLPFMRIDEGAANIDTTFSTPSQLFNDTWHHIVFGRSLSEHFVYLDGVKQTPTTPDSTLADLTNISNFYIGATGGASPSEVFSGLIDEVRVYDVALNDQQVFQLYNATNCAIGDSNCSGKVNTLDLSYLLSKFGIYDSYADFNIDGIVDSADLSILLSNFGN